MKVTTLVENTEGLEGLGCEHGLSIYVETLNHRILVDTGASGLFAENAGKMGINLSTVDVAVISHGHYDHGGGLKAFLEINSNAKIYASRRAFDKHMALRSTGEAASIGLDEGLAESDRLVFVDESLVIDDELSLFSGVMSKRLSPSCNGSLLKEVDGTLEKDDFDHEQNLAISENGSVTLLVGCAHCGIVNIMDAFHEKHGDYPAHVIGGLHMYSGSLGTTEDPSAVAEVGEYLAGTKARLHTCHCTGIQPYRWLKSILGDSIDYISTGSSFVI